MNDQPLQVWVVSMRDDAPEAVFSSPEKAQAYLGENPGDIYILGPYTVDQPDDE